jgi:hypothetical protein
VDLSDDQNKQGVESMKALFAAGSLVLALIPAAAMAQQSAACERVEFSQDVLARFPNIRGACLDVISRDGQEFAVVKADLVRATARRMTVRVKRPDGTRSDPIGVNIRANERINVNGRMTPIDQVAIGQELSVYIHVKDPGIALASEEAGPVEFTPVTAEPEPEPAPVAAAAPEPEMPKTATRLPLAGVLGLGLLALGAGIALVRRRARA